MLLSIDTANNKKTIVKLAEQQFVRTKRIPGQQKLLELIDAALAKTGKTKNDISEIKVNTGPGSYTGLRIGVSVANIMAYALGIKVNGKKQVEAKYD